MTPAEKRYSARKAVNWAVHAKGDGVSIVGAAIRDVSGSGIFVEPQMETRLPVAETSLGLTVFANGWGQGLHGRGLVRWVGRSERHGCDGLGIELQDENLAAQLLERMTDEP